MASSPVWNFGRNVAFIPASVEVPVDEAQLVDLLANNRDRPFRVLGSLHSWNRIVETKGLALDLSRFDDVRVESRGDRSVAHAGAGCTIENLLRALDSAGLTLPTIGAVKRQTIAGAIATGTHGSGARSLSSYVTAVRMITLDREGVPSVRVIDSGSGLEAVRCSLGALGVITEVTIEVVPKFSIEESLENAESLDEILSWEEEYPLQQFILMPWAWTWTSFRRRVVERPSGWVKRLFRRGVNALFMDFGLHALLWLLIRTTGAKSVLKRVVPKAIITGVVVADDNERILTMNHHWFRHVEMELLIPPDRIHEAVDLVRALLEIAAGERRADPAIPGSKRIEGIWTHHYPIFFRRVLNDDTMISMSAPLAAEQWWYSLSLFSYSPELENFAAMVNLIARTLARELGARPHWGKFHRLEAVDLRGLYPRYDEFVETARRFDPSGRFANDYLSGTLGL
ncbi:MAG: FAD-binding protein [Acidobacteria bacterium]|nr:FAD-binding protein [Acidobacteriota bacterium]